MTASARATGAGVREAPPRETHPPGHVRPRRTLVEEHRTHSCILPNSLLSTGELSPLRETERLLCTAELTPKYRSTHSCVLPNSLLSTGELSPLRETEQLLCTAELTLCVLLNSLLSTAQLTLCVLLNSVR
eukprot:7056982-Pyramimonas_sp.AAC.1